MDNTNFLKLMNYSYNSSEFKPSSLNNSLSNQTMLNTSSHYNDSNKNIHFRGVFASETFEYKKENILASFEYGDLCYIYDIDKIYVKSFNGSFILLQQDDPKNLLVDSSSVKDTGNLNNTSLTLDNGFYELDRKIQAYFQKQIDDILNESRVIYEEYKRRSNEIQQKLKKYALYQHPCGAPTLFEILSYKMLRRPSIMELIEMNEKGIKLSYRDIKRYNSEASMITGIHLTI